MRVSTESKKQANSITAAALVAVMFVLSAGACAQVEVVESSPTIRGLGQQRSNTSPSAQAPTAQTQTAPGLGNAQAEFFYEMQMLQEEVKTLRGLVEELGHEVRRLKQQRTDDYLDLDRRLSELSRGGASTGSSQRAPASDGTRSEVLPRPPVIAAPSSPSSADEMTAYRNAMDFLLQKKDYDSAVQALNEYLQKWPTGSYAPNSHYWLGEIYLLKNDLPEAQRWFTQLVEKFPEDRKANDAKFKLGRVYFQMGDKAKAKTLFEEVVSSNGDAAPLARNFLQENY